MSTHVYLARPGFTQTPISVAEWMDAAKKTPQLEAMKSHGGDGIAFNSVTLRGNPQQRLTITSYGLVDAPAPNRALIEAMFAVAPLLGAGVYSEDMKQYRSPNHWAKQTGNTEAGVPTGPNLRLIAMIVLLIAGLAAGVLLKP